MRSAEKEKMGSMEEKKSNCNAKVRYRGVERYKIFFLRSEEAPNFYHFFTVLLF